MRKNQIHKILSRFVDAKPEETLSCVLLFFYFFLITSSAYIIKPVKISLFLKWLNPDELPFAYLLTALLMGFVISLNYKLLHAMKRELYISISLAFFISNLLLFWLLFKLQWPWLSMIYWFWADIFTVTSVTQFWILVNDIYNPRQARRLVGFLVSGGLLGGVAGSLLATFLAKSFGTENLLLTCPILLAFCLLIVKVVHQVIRKEKRKEPEISTKEIKPKVRYIKSFHQLRKNRHLMIMSGIMATAIIVTTLIDFQFNTIVKMTYENTDLRTAFLGTFFTVLLIFSSLFHILLTNRILKNFGIRIALLIAPLFLLICSGAILVVPMIPLIYWAVIIKGTDKSLAHSLSQSVRELLYIPIPPDIKYRAKVFIDMFVNKFAKGLGALLILLFFTVLHFNLKQISFITMVVILFWILFNLMITREYVTIVKKNLKIKWQDADKFVSENIDIDMTKLVFDTIQSRERSSVLYAMNLFDLVKRKGMSPELKKIISYKSDEIRAGSMDALLELDGEVLIPEIDDALEDDSLDTQIKEIMSLNVYQELMQEKIDMIVNEPGRETEVSRMEAAKALGMMKPTSNLIRNLSKLLKDESPEVIRYALESAGRLRRRELVHLIIQQLNKPMTCQIASQALVEYGVKILGTLKDYLGDSEEDIHIRKAIPDILVRIGSQRAADLLALELKRGRKDVEDEIIEAIYKMRFNDSQLMFQRKIIMPEMIQKIKKSCLILIEMHDLMADEKKDPLVKDLENDLARSLKHIFELISLIYPREDIMRAYQNICTGTKKLIDYSIELLDNMLRKEIKELLLPLIDDIPFEDKVRKCQKMLKALEKT